jgi:hypothetical protein
MPEGTSDVPMVPMHHESANRGRRHRQTRGFCHVEAPQTAFGSMIDKITQADHLETVS